MTTCSPAHKVAKPQRSAARATAPITSGSAPGPMPRAWRPTCTPRRARVSRPGRDGRRAMSMPAGPVHRRGGPIGQRPAPSATGSRGVAARERPGAPRARPRSPAGAPCSPARSGRRRANGRPSTRFIDSLASRRAIGLFAASSAASSRAASASWSGATTARTAPSRCISAAETCSPVKNISRALYRPTSRDRCALAPRRPTLISVVPKRAASEATKMSQQAAKARPAPRAGPLTAAITGTAQSTMAHMASRATLPGSVTARAGTSSAGAFWSTDLRSTPAMKALVPVAVKTATRTSRSALSAVNVSRISAMVARVMALTGGRSRVTVAM